VRLRSQIAARFFAWVLPSLALFSASSSPAKVYEVVSPPNVEVYPLFDARLDFALRIEAINRAKYSVDVVVYMNTGEIGVEMTTALQAAISRGVKVRFVTEAITTVGLTRPFGSNLPDRLARTLSSNADCPSEVLCLSPFQKRFGKGIDIFDAFHEKILLIDRDTPDEIAWVGGRNNDHYALGDLDFSVVMKRIDRTRPSACSALGRAYDDIWVTANAIQKGKTTPVTPSRGHPRNFVSAPDPGKLVADSKLTSEETYQAMRSALFEGERSPARSFQPTKMIFSSNDFFKQLQSKQLGTWMADRDEITNDNLRLLAKRIRRSKEIVVTAMAFDMPKELKEALTFAIRNGAHVSFITNSPELEKKRIPFAVQFDQSMKDLKELYDLSVGPNGKGKVEIFLLDPLKIAQSEEYSGWLTYLHRKAVITDGTVALGSDNYTDASRLKNNEFLLEMEDGEFAKFMRAQVENEMKLFRPVGCTELFQHASRSRNWARSVAAKFFRQFL
jgi:phosphatidylserine/phosphatidylglycerophosphate/cardiolipin synthase-like enzyme